ncbi:hypothetical protein MIMGU_mgv1a0125501mg, partial [Erythranthe guttata]
MRASCLSFIGFILDLKLQQTMVEMFPLTSEDAAYNKIKGTLSTVTDPFTRIIS